LVTLENKDKLRMGEFPDVVIAATAITYDLKLVTRDEHFKKIDGLEVEDY